MPERTRRAARPPTPRDAAPERPRRLTLSNVVEMLLARSSGDRSYVTLTRNARGDTQVEVKVNTAEHGDVTTPDEAEAKALEIYERIGARFPGRETREQVEASLTRNAKGETQIAVQVRSGEDGDVRTAADVSATVQAQYDALRRRYPLADGNTARPGTVAGDDGG